MKSIYEPPEDEIYEDVKFWNDWFDSFKDRIKKRDDRNKHRVRNLLPFKRSTPACVYLIECEGIYKIGKAVNANERLIALQGGNPFKLKLIKACWFRDAFYVENQIHKALRTRRVKNDHNNEWFVLSPNDLKNVLEMIELGS